MSEMDDERAGEKSPEKTTRHPPVPASDASDPLVSKQGDGQRGARLRELLLERRRVAVAGGNAESDSEALPRPPADYAGASSGAGFAAGGRGRVWLLRQAIAKRAANNAGAGAGPEPQRPLAELGQNRGRQAKGWQIMLRRPPVGAPQQNDSAPPASNEGKQRSAALEQRVRELTAEVERLRGSQTSEPPGQPLRPSPEKKPTGQKKKKR